MKELTQMRGDSLLFIQDKGTLIGYKVTKEVFAGICEQFIDLKKRPKNLLFEKQQGCEDGIRLIEGNVTVFVPSTSIRFSFRIANAAPEEKCLNCGCELPLDKDKLCKGCVKIREEEQLTWKEPTKEELREAVNKVDLRKHSKETAEGIVENNCLDCKEFEKPLSESECMCEPVHDLFDQAGMSEYIAGKSFEKAREKFLNIPCKKCGRTDLDLHEDRTCPVCRQEAETRQANRDAHAQDYPEDARARSFDGGF